jgi:hypothetical protein
MRSPSPTLHILYKSHTNCQSAGYPDKSSSDASYVADIGSGRSGRSGRITSMGCRAGVDAGAGHKYCGGGCGNGGVGGAPTSSMGDASGTSIIRAGAVTIHGPLASLAFGTAAVGVGDGR